MILKDWQGGSGLKLRASDKKVGMAFSRGPAFSVNQTECNDLVSKLGCDKLSLRGTSTLG